MPDHYDFLEIRDPAQRRSKQAARLPEIVQMVQARAWAKRLSGIFQACRCAHFS